MAGPRKSGIGVIALGLDGSPNSQEAARWAVRLAAATGARVVAVHALGLIERLDPDSGPTPVETHVNEIEARLVNDWCEPLAAGRVSYTVEGRYGPPVQVLVDVAGREEADLLIVGSRGCGGSTALLLGSTSSRLAHAAPCPVVIVPLPADAPSRPEGLRSLR